MASPRSDDRRDLRGTLGALLFIAVGGIAWWDTLGTPSLQAVVFPRTVIGLMAFFSGLLIVRNMLGYAAPEARGAAGSVPRRVGLVAVMLIAAWVMSYIGFVIAALVAYLAIMAIAMYERWTPARCLLYPISGVAVVLGFHFVFVQVFQVPLPTPIWFSLPF